MRPDILLVAMGVPRQEFWIAKNITSSHCTLPIAVGALLDFLSGSVPRAPAWMRRLRLEWVFRLIVEPGRLWRRYVLGNPVFLARVVRQKLFVERAGGNPAVNSRFVAEPAGKPLGEAANVAGTTAMVTASYAPDFERCRLLCETIDRFVTGAPRHYILVEQRDVALFRQLGNARPHGGQRARSAAALAETLSTIRSACSGGASG